MNLIATPSSCNQVPDFGNLLFCGHEDVPRPARLPLGGEEHAAVLAPLPLDDANNLSCRLQRADRGYFIISVVWRIFGL